MISSLRKHQLQTNINFIIMYRKCIGLFRKYNNFRIVLMSGAAETRVRRWFCVLYIFNYH